jgi:adenine-specific DNA-methyltransferase
VAKLEDLIKEIADPAIRRQIQDEVARLKARKKFGLVFEEHIPETIQLPNITSRAGTRVVKQGAGAHEIFLVTSVGPNGKVTIRSDRGTDEVVRASDLIPIKRFGEPIYPSLIPVASVQRGGNKPFHTLINADNFHASVASLHL